MFYRKYSESIIKAIVLSRNPNLFPELKIPRTTALYWISNYNRFTFHEDDKVLEHLVNKIKTIETRNRKLQSENTFLKDALNTIIKGFNIDIKSCSKSIRSRIMTMINRSNCLSLNKKLSYLSIPEKVYASWKQQICKISSDGTCVKRKINQLTHKEVFTMRSMLTAKSFLHYPISSLYYYCLRNRILGCSLDTWYKYNKIFGIKRISIKKQKVYPVGIRASKPNELWHIDASIIKLKNGNKVYLQAVIDNYSRAIISYKITDNINAVNTTKLIKKCYKEIQDSNSLMMDPGTENRNEQVSQYLFSKNIKRIIARMDISFSNSMIEAFFKKLKSHYLYFKSLSSIQDVKRKISFFIKEYNEKMPQSILQGATPSEILKGNWSQSINNEFAQFKKESKLKRLEVNQHICAGC